VSYCDEEANENVEYPMMMMDIYQNYSAMIRFYRFLLLYDSPGNSQLR
jgi:SpoVK/Ycf46/Vps4 family AAA+-type ATPase